MCDDLFFLLILTTTTTTTTTTSSSSIISIDLYMFLLWLHQLRRQQLQYRLYTKGECRFWSLQRKQLCMHWLHWSGVPAKPLWHKLSSLRVLLVWRHLCFEFNIVIIIHYQCWLDRGCCWRWGSIITNSCYRGCFDLPQETWPYSSNVSHFPYSTALLFIFFVFDFVFLMCREDMQAPRGDRFGPTHITLNPMMMDDI